MCSASVCRRDLGGAYQSKQVEVGGPSEQFEMGLLEQLPARVADGEARVKAYCGATICMRKCVNQDEKL